MDVGSESIYTFNVTDMDDTFNVSVVGGLPDDSELIRDGNSFEFRWRLMEAGNITVVFSAVDSMNAGSVLRPTVEICACENDGNCTLEGILGIDALNPIILNCECPQGWS